MIVVGLTGSIAMGKSTVGKMFAEEGVAVFDSDAAVHALYRSPDAQAVEAAFPGVLVDGAIDRDRLAARVVGHSAALARLEGIVHPLVRKARDAFLARAAAERRPLVVVDAPLLFESGGDGAVDAILVVSAPEAVQKQRALSRGGMTSERLEKIIARQIPDREKRRRAHMIIDTNGPFDLTRAQVRGFLRSAAAMARRKIAADA
jgi:dephospho-CoA kinase